MNPKKFNNIFSQEELDILNNAISHIVIPVKEDGSYVYDDEDPRPDCTISETLGRLQFSGFVKKDIILVCEKISEFVKSFAEDNVVLSNILYVEYNNKYGTPVLPPHFDGDSSDFIVNFQLSGNTTWDIGLDFNIYSMENNSALVFDGNKSIHWRPKKIFKDGEYVKMIFFRFQNLNSSIDNSHLRYSLDNEIYKDVNKFRDSLISNHL